MKVRLSGGTKLRKCWTELGGDQYSAILFADCQGTVPDSCDRRTALTIAHTRQAEIADGCIPRVGTPFTTWTFEAAAEAATDLFTALSCGMQIWWETCRGVSAKFFWQPARSTAIFLPDVSVASRVIPRRIGLTTDKTVSLLCCWFIVVTNISNADWRRDFIVFY